MKTTQRTNRQNRRQNVLELLNHIGAFYMNVNLNRRLDKTAGRIIRRIPLSNLGVRDFFQSVTLNSAV